MVKGVLFVSLFGAALLVLISARIVPPIGLPQQQPPIESPSKARHVRVDTGRTVLEELLQVEGDEKTLILSSQIGKSLRTAELGKVLPPPPQNIHFDNSTARIDYLEFLTPLRDVDRELYTIRINTYNRHALLALSVHHHVRCPGVAQIQIIWSESGEPPLMITNLTSVYKDKVIVENHRQVNSLNERFRMLTPTPTLGILSMDDDVLRPCVAIDSAFFQWTQYPHAMVGYDARGHAVKNGKFMYRGDARVATLGYSMTLPRYAFIHRDYLHWYTTTMPSTILEYVTGKMNCEDLAMSMFVTRLSGGVRPLLADAWARWSAIQLSSDNELSNKKRHRTERMVCLNEFAPQLGMMPALVMGNTSDGMAGARTTPSFFAMGPAPLGNESWLDSDYGKSFGTKKQLQLRRYKQLISCWASYRNLTAMAIRVTLKKWQVHTLRSYRPLLEAWNATHLLADPLVM
jgi:glucuronyl/N-acetylglucosaminyl transferase EXT2